MNSIYICKDCRTTFKRPAIQIETHGLESPPYEEFKVCPNCASLDYIRAIACYMCGEYITEGKIAESDEFYLCEDCFTVIDFEDLEKTSDHDFFD